MRLTIVTLVVLITTAARSAPIATTKTGSVPERLSREWRLLRARLIACACSAFRRKEGSVRLASCNRAPTALRCGDVDANVVPLHR